MTRKVLVIGSGIAGMTAARHAREAGHEVLLVTKHSLGDGCTVRAQGGIAGVVFPDDTVASHVADTLIAGAGHCDFDAVHVLCEHGGESIRELARQGVEFDTDANGGWSRGLEGAHSIARIVHAGGDATGARVHEALVAAARQAGVRMLEHRMLRKLIVRDSRVVGAEFVVTAQDAAYGPERAPLLPRAMAPDEAGALPERPERILEPEQVERTSGAESDDLGARPERAEIIEADAVVLATGGFGALYPFTTNPASATGDGIVAAARAGAEVEDLEFVQFHPTVLAVGEPFLISEAVRGEGATLVDETGHAFMQDVDPRGDLASRDVVARAIAERATPASDAPASDAPASDAAPSDAPASDAPASDAAPSDAPASATPASDARSNEAPASEASMRGERPKGVYLDATALGQAFLESRFPTIDAALRARGLDWSREPIPVRPGAHFAMGGVATDLWGRTTVPGLYAVGEVACTGVHGANRLASNSLLEGAVFGARVADAIASDADRRTATPSRDTPQSLIAQRTHRNPQLAAPAAPHFTREALQSLMWRHVGLIRTEAGLAQAQAHLDAWLQNPEPRELEDQNLLELAALVTQSARARTESIGAHFRSDAASQPRPQASAKPHTPAHPHALAHH